MGIGQLEPIDIGGISIMNASHLYGVDERRAAVPARRKLGDDTGTGGIRNEVVVGNEEGRGGETVLGGLYIDIDR